MTDTAAYMPPAYQIKFTTVSECPTCGIQRESMKIEDYWLFEQFFISKGLNPFDYIRDLRVNTRTASYRHGSMVTSDLFGGARPETDSLQRQFFDWFAHENGRNASLKYSDTVREQRHCRYCAKFL